MRSEDRLLARERSREDDKGEHERPDGGAGQTREPREPERPPHVAPEVLTGSPADQDAARRDLERSPQTFNRAAATEQQRDVGPSR